MKKFRLFISIFFLLISQDKIFSSVYSNKKGNFIENKPNFIKHFKNSSNYYEDSHVRERNHKNKSKFDFVTAIYLRLFFNDLIANLEDDKSDKKFKISELEIFSDSKVFNESIFNAEGNVIIRTHNAVTRADIFSYDQDSKIMILKGDIKFKSKNSFLEASHIKYDFINKKGFILDAYGSADFDDISSLTLSESDKSKEKLNEDFKIIKEIKDVKINSSSDIKLSNVIREYDEEKSFRERLFDQNLDVKFNEVNITRFVAKKIEINNDEWFSESLTLTNDPYNKPQLKIKNKNFRTKFNEDNTKIRAQWSTAILENKLPIPLGPRRIDVDKNQNFKWGNGYDKEKFDGFYIYRGFDKFDLGDNSQLNLTTTFPIQRILTGETKAFPKNNDLVIGDKIKQDANFYDYFGLEAFLKREKEDSKFIFNIATNSLDFEKLDKATEIESYFTINLFEEETKSDQEILKEEELVEVIGDEIKDNLKISKDLTFFGSYREKTKNGSLGDIVVKSAFGTRYDIYRKKEKNNYKSFSEKTFAIGNYESSSKSNSKELINKNRINFSYKKRYEYDLWKPKVSKYINNEYKYSPIVIPKGLYWNLEGNLDFFRYDDGNAQDQFLIKTGPKLVLGEFKGDFLDYTEISIQPRFKFSNGESPFRFDQVVDTQAIELKASQQIYGPLVLNFSGTISLDKSTSNNDKLIDPVLDLAWSRRAYYINIFYNLDSEVGGIGFKINTFNFKGLGEKFD